MPFANGGSVLHYVLTRAEYDALESYSDTSLYFVLETTGKYSLHKGDKDVTSDPGVSYTKAQIDSLMSGIASTYYSKDAVDAIIAGVTRRIPQAAKNGTLTIKQGGVTKATFGADSSENVTAELDAGGSGGEKNVIEAITLDGAEVPVKNKVAAISLPIMAQGKLGVARVNPLYGTNINNGKYILIVKADASELAERTHDYKPIVPSNLNAAIIAALSDTNHITLTTEQQQTAKTVLGIVIPTALSALSDDSTHRLVTDTEKSSWDSKSTFSGSYNDLSNKPTLFSGDYNDLSNKPTIPTVNDATIIIRQGGVVKGTFTLNQSGNLEIDLDAGGESSSSESSSSESSSSESSSSESSSSESSSSESSSSASVQGILVSGAGFNAVNGFYPLVSGTFGTTSAIYRANGYDVFWRQEWEEWDLSPSNVPDDAIYYSKSTNVTGQWEPVPGVGISPAPTVTEGGSESSSSSSESSSSESSSSASAPVITVTGAGLGAYVNGSYTLLSGTYGEQDAVLVKDAGTENEAFIRYDASYFLGASWVIYSTIMESSVYASATLESGTWWASSVGFEPDATVVIG